MSKLQISKLLSRKASRQSLVKELNGGRSGQPIGRAKSLQECVYCAAEVAGASDGALPELRPSQLRGSRICNPLGPDAGVAVARLRIPSSAVKVCQSSALVSASDRGLGSIYLEPLKIKPIPLATQMHSSLRRTLRVHVIGRRQT